MKKEFKVPVSNVLGCNFFDLLKQAKKYKIDKKYRFIFIKTLMASAFITLFSILDRISYHRLKKTFKTDEAPIFIIGHWRSGTTLLHNLMCKDPKAGNTSTYQTILPHNLFGMQFMLKKIIAWCMPPTRPYDNVKIHPDFPQEEEFALANTFHLGHYLFFFYPKKREEIYENLKNWDKLSEEDKNLWYQTYDDLVKRSLINTKKSRYVSKNPPNTFRIPQLLKLYPNAKFIYIHRNPYEVYPSTFNFFKSIINNVGFHDVSDADLKEYVLKVYKDMMNKYEKDKTMLSDKNLIEIKYEDFVKSPSAHLTKIYNHFNMEISDSLKENWDTEENNAKNHKINAKSFDNELVEETNKYLEEYILSKNYKLLGTA